MPGGSDFSVPQDEVPLEKRPPDLVCGGQPASEFELRRGGASCKDIARAGEGIPAVDSLRSAGVPIAPASDHKPGSSPGLSLLLMLNMARTLFRMTPEEAVRGVTVNGARALGLPDRGSPVVGKKADMAVWDLDHSNELACWFSWNPCRQVIINGVPVK